MINENNKSGNNVIYFDKYLIVGCLVLKQITDDGKYIYEMFYLNYAEYSYEYFFGIKVSDDPITKIVAPTVQCTFNKDIIDSLVKNNDEIIINMAKKLSAEVLGKEYSQTSSYRGTEPWASIDDAIELAKKEISEGKEIENVIELMINDALSKTQKLKKI